MLDNARRVADFLTTYMRGGLDSVRSYIDEEFTWWSARSGEIQDRLVEIEQITKRHYKAPLEFAITGLTTEGDRVAVEAESHAELENGAIYHNRYHFLVVLRNGQIVTVREYGDTKHVAEIWGSIL